MEFILLRKRLKLHLGPHGPGVGRVTRMVVAGAVALAAGMGAKAGLGYSSGAGFLPGILEDGSFWLDPLAAMGTAGAFGVAYLGVAAGLGVGGTLRPKKPAQA